MAEEQEYTITIRVEVEEDEPEYAPPLAEIALLLIGFSRNER